jgi:hypothetical protein
MKASCISLLILSRYGKMDGVASYLDKRGMSAKWFPMSEEVVLNLRRTLGRSHLLLVAILILWRMTSRNHNNSDQSRMASFADAK